MNKKNIITALLTIVATFTANAQLTDWQNLSNKNFVMRIIHDENYLYVGTKGGGLIKIDKQSGEQTVLYRADGSMTDNTIEDMAIHDGALWVGTGYNGLAKITDGHIEKFDMRNAGFFSNQHIGGFYFGNDGSMLVGGFSYLFQFDGKQVTNSFYITPLSPYAYVNSIKADKDGRIWVGCYDAQNRATLCVYTSQDLVPYTNTYRSINRLETDADGCLWMASERGLVKFDSGLLASTAATGLPTTPATLPYPATACMTSKSMPTTTSGWPPLATSALPASTAPTGTFTTSITPASRSTRFSESQSTPSVTLFGSPITQAAASPSPD